MRAEQGNNFISSIEGLELPFYGTQFHPEKEFLSFDPQYHFNHSEMSEHVARKYSDFFVHKARKNYNMFDTYEHEVAELVENYELVVTDKYLGAFYAFMLEGEDEKKEKAEIFE